MKEDWRGDARSFDDPRYVGAPFGLSPIVGVRIRIAFGDALEVAIPGDPFRLVVVGKLGPNGGTEPVEKVKEV